jgi:hypothetical protein
MVDHFNDLNQDLVTSVTKVSAASVSRKCLTEFITLTKRRFVSSNADTPTRRYADTPLRRHVSPPGFNYPSVGLVDHFYDLGEDLIARVINFIENLLAKITVSEGNLSMDLGLGGFSLRVIKL